MKKIVIPVLLCVAVALSAVLWNKSTPVVNNAEEAVEIGKAVIKEHYPEVYESIEADIIAEEKDGIWHVYNDFERIKYFPDGSKLVTMGGGYYVDIDGNTGEVVKIGVYD